MKKNVLIIGPISDLGGREVEVNVIAKSLEDDFKVKIFSTGYMSSQSSALQNLQSTTFSSLTQELLKKYPLIKLMSLISYLKNSCKGSYKNYAANKVSKEKLNYDKKRLQIIYEVLSKTDLVFLTVQLSSNFVEEVIGYCHKKNIPVIIRTTGTLFYFPKYLHTSIKKVTAFIHHSKNNAERLTEIASLPYKVIDQTTLQEKKLFLCDKDIEIPLRFGFLGRLSEEKNILPLVKYFVTKEYPFYIAGDGPQKSMMLSMIEKSENCMYLGRISSDRIDEFFNTIDVLIIASSEETGPLVGIEAMASGTIILSTKVGAMTNRFKDVEPNFWFDINNIKTLDDKIRFLSKLNLNTIKNIGNQLQEVYKNYYSFSTVKGKYLEAVRDVFEKVTLADKVD